MVNSQDENGKINQVLTYISTDNIIELTELIYAGVKLVCEKIGIPSKSTKEKSKPGWEFQINTQGKRTKGIKQRKDAVTCRDRKKKATQEKIITQLEEINQKVLAKEGRLQRYRQRVKQYRKNKTFQKNERKFYQ